MDPTAVESADWKVLLDAARWSGLVGEVNDLTTSLGSVFALLGATESTPLRTVAAINEDDFLELLSNLKIGESATDPTPIERSAAVLMGRATRVACGVQLSAPAARAAAEAESAHTKMLEKLQMELDAAKAAADAPPPPPTDVGPPRKKIKLSTIADQVNDQEVEVLDNKTVDELYANYVDRFGSLPPDGEEATVEQLTAISVLLASNAPPYVDFAVFGPHGYRLQRKLKLAGYQICPGGEIRHVELAGPPTFAMWQRCYRVLRTALVSHNAVSPAKLDAYHDHHLQYHERYGPRVWHIQYQGDVRCRQERMIHHLRVASAEHAIAVKENRTTAFDPKRPWDHVWQLAVQDFYWWRKEVEEPCLLVVARTASLDSMVDGDVEIADVETPKKTKRPAAAHANWSHHTSIGQGGFNLVKPHNSERFHNVQNGAYSTNRKGVQLCPEFQTGACTEADGDRRCRKNHNLVHQCEKCLSPEHPGSQCTKTPSQDYNGAQPAWVRFGSKGKSKGGKGKGKGKEKGKRPYWG